MLHQTFLFLGQLWQLFEVSQILEFLRYADILLTYTKDTDISRYLCSSWQDCFCNFTILSNKFFDPRLEMELDAFLLMHLQMSTYRIYSAFTQVFPSRKQITKSVLCKFCYETSFALPKQSQRSRSILKDGSRFLGLFWKEKTLSYNRRNMALLISKNNAPYMVGFKDNS